MQKTPDEIKKGLECCHIYNEDTCECMTCPYSHNGWCTERCDTKLAEDALALIQRLQEKNDAMHEEIVRLQAERDAAVACIPRECVYCKHDGTADFDADSVCDYCLNGNTRWEWRGVQKEE